MKLPRFRLRTLMIIVALIAVAISWFDSPLIQVILGISFILGFPVIGALIDRRRGRSGILGGGFGGMAESLVCQLIDVILSGFPGNADPQFWAISVVLAAIGFMLGIPIGGVVCVIGELVSRHPRGDRDEMLDLTSPPAE